jgi:hypothetical protein
MAVEDVEELEPIIEDALKSTYGETAQNIEILRANQIPILDQKKESWRATVEFDDSKIKYQVSIDIRISDGSVKRTEEIVKNPLS